MYTVLWMALFIPAGFGQAVAHFTFTSGQSNPINMVFGYESLGIQGPDFDASDIGSEIATVFGVSGFTNQVIFDSLSILRQPGDETGVAIYGTGGGSSLSSLPPNCCVLAHKRTATGGRVGRGRMYWPSVTTTGVTENGVIGGPSVAVYQGAFNGLLIGLLGKEVPMVVLHENVGLTPSRVLTLQCDPVIATQRRRMRS